MNLELLKQELIRDEGLRTVSYRDTMGLWTIGVGHLLNNSKDWTGLTWTLDQVHHQLDLDVQICVALAATVPAYLSCNTDARQRALANMAFEMGHKLLTFNTFLSLLGQGKYKEAGEDLRSTLWYKEVPVRAERIINMIEKG